MDLAWLQPAVTAPGPFTTVHLDVSRDTEDARTAVELRWQAVRHRLEQDGAPAGLLDRIGAAVVAETGRSGEAGRTLVAAGDEIVLDQVTPRRPLRDSGHHGMLAHLMPLVRALDAELPYALVEVDRSGADVTVVDPLAGERREHEVEGGHELLHAVGGGGWAHRRYRSRVQDSWDRNADAVARDVERLVDRHHPQVLVLSGDPVAAGRLLERLGDDARSRLVQVEGGGRPEGIDEEKFAGRVADVVMQWRQRRMGDVLARYAEAAGRDERAAAGLAAVVEALRGGAVEVLLLHDEPSSDLTLWAGEDPMHLGTTREDVEALGAQQVEQDRADAVLVRAAVAQDAAMELVGPSDALTDGIGALLRFDVRPPVPGGRS